MTKISVPFLFGETPRIDSIGRSVTWTFDGPKSDEPGWNHRIVLSVRHDKDTKTYRATLRRCLFTDRGTYRMEKTEVLTMADHVSLGTSDPVARYNENALRLFAGSVATKACWIVNGIQGEPGTRSEKLLAEAVGYNSPARRLAGAR